MKQRRNGLFYNLYPVDFRCDGRRIFQALICAALLVLVTPVVAEPEEEAPAADDIENEVSDASDETATPEDVEDVEDRKIEAAEPIPETTEDPAEPEVFEDFEDEEVDDVQIESSDEVLEFDIGDVVVTGTMTEKQMVRTPVRTRVIGQQQMERRKAVSLADALESNTGVRVENNCQNCGFLQVRLNGLDGRYSQILIDGVPVFSSLAGVYGIEQIPAEMIERIEIVKGGGSALYGGNAVAGVVNVITTRPRQNFANFNLQGQLTGMKKPDLRMGANAGVIHPERNMAVHVFGSSTVRTPWDANGDGFSEIGEIRSVMAGAETYMDVLGGELQLKFHTLQERRRGGDSFGKPVHDAAVAEAVDTRRYGGELRFSRLVNAHLSYNLGYGLAYTERDSYYGSGGDVEFDDPPTAEQWDEKQAALNAYGTTRNPLHIGDARVNLAFEGLGEQIVTVGGQVISDQLEDRFPGYGRQIDEHYWTVAGFVQHNWIFPKLAETIMGLRFDQHSELDNLIVNPRAALMLTPTSWLRTRTSVATGFRAPQVFDEDLHITLVEGEGQVVYNDPDLTPERSVSVTHQFEFDVDLTHQWNLRFGVNGFLTAIRDAFAIENDDDPDTANEMEMLRVNSGKTIVAGGEIDVNMVWRNVFGVGGGWTLQRARNTEVDPDFGSRQVYRTPSQYGFVELFARPRPGLDLSTMMDFTGPMKVPHYAGYIDEDTLETTPWFADWSANVSYRIDLKHERYLTPFVGIRNLLDSRQSDYDRGSDRDAGYVYGPRLPRSLFIGLKGGM